MIIKKSIQFISLILTPIIIYIIFSFLLLLFPSKSKCTEHTKTIYIYQDFAHTEILIPVPYFKQEYQHYFPTLLKNKNHGYLAFSYGDKKFMMEVPSWSDIKVAITLKSLFLNTPALLRIGYYWDIKKEECIKIKLSDKCLNKLQHSIFDSFSKKGNHFIRYYDHYKQDNIFYFQAKKSYNMFHTCNSWTSDKLRDAGLKASYLTPFSQQVIYPYQ